MGHGQDGAHAADQFIAHDQQVGLLALGSEVGCKFAQAFKQGRVKSAAQSPIRSDQNDQMLGRWIIKAPKQRGGCIIGFPAQGTEHRRQSIRIGHSLQGLGLGTAQLARGHHFHGRDDLSRGFHAADPPAKFLQIRHNLRLFHQKAVQTILNDGVEFRLDGLINFFVFANGL